VTSTSVPQPQPSDRRLLTVGVDLASQPDNSAVCIIDWSGQSADVRALACTFAGRQLDDNTRLGLLERANKAAIDAPFGWRSQVRRRKVDQMAPAKDSA
jgi:hypothetical protein